MFNAAIDDLAVKQYIPHNGVFANVLRDNLGIVYFDLQGHGGCWRPKTPLGGQKRHVGVDLMKKVFDKSCSTTSKIP